jgi:hypothetical protein
MLAGADDNRIKFFLVVKQFAEVSRFASLGELLGSGVQVVFIDIAQGNNVFRFEFGEVPSTTTTGADYGDIEFLIQIASAQDVGRRKCRGGSNSGAGLQKRSAIETFRGYYVLLF